MGLLWALAEGPWMFESSAAPYLHQISTDKIRVLCYTIVVFDRYEGEDRKELVSWESSFATGVDVRTTR